MHVKFGIIVECQKIWDNLDPTIRNIEKLLKYKRELKRANEYYNTIHMHVYYSNKPRDSNASYIDTNQMLRIIFEPLSGKE